jgi:hypothetical protein
VITARNLKILFTLTTPTGYTYETQNAGESFARIRFSSTVFQYTQEFHASQVADKDICIVAR